MYHVCPNCTLVGTASFVMCLHAAFSYKLSLCRAYVVIFTVLKKIIYI